MKYLVLDMVGEPREFGVGELAKVGLCPLESRRRDWMSHGARAETWTDREDASHLTACGVEQRVGCLRTFSPIDQHVSLKYGSCKCRS